MYKRKCKNCGKEFKTTNSRRIYHNYQCYLEFCKENYGKTRTVVHSRKCPVCEKTFQTTVYNKKYCNELCHRKSTLKKLRERKKKLVPKKEPEIRLCLWCRTQIHYPQKNYCSEECRSVFNKIRKRIFNEYSSDPQPELEKLLELGKNYRFEDQNLNNFYGLS